MKYIIRFHINIFIVTAIIFFSGCNSGKKDDNSVSGNANEHLSSDSHNNETGDNHAEGDIHNHDAHSGHDHTDGDGHNHETGDNHAEGDVHNHDAHSGHDHTDGDDHNHESEYSGEIHFTKQQAKAVGLQLEEVTPGAFSHVIKTSGQILSAQSDEVTIVATSNGVVSFVKSSISDGMSIHAGEAIVTISAKNLLEGDPVIKAKIAYETALKEYQRAELLIKEQVISQKDFNETKLRYETAKATYEAQADNITASGVNVTSPISGYIRDCLVSQGEYVSVGQPIVTISQNSRLQLRAEVSENYYKSLKSIGNANFQTSYDNTVYKLSNLNGRLLSFGKASGGQSFYIPVTFEFDNTGDIIPGSFVSVWLLTNAQDNVISVPVAAITEEQGLNFVYLQLDEEGYYKQEVAIGQGNGDRVQILSGLKPGDKVVTRGIYQVKLAAISSVMPEGHSHSH